MKLGAMGKYTKRNSNPPLRRGNIKELQDDIQRTSNRIDEEADRS